MANSSLEQYVSFIERFRWVLVVFGALLCCAGLWLGFMGFAMHEQCLAQLVQDAEAKQHPMLDVVNVQGLSYLPLFVLAALGFCFAGVSLAAMPFGLSYRLAVRVLQLDTAADLQAAEAVS